MTSALADLLQQLRGSIGELTDEFMAEMQDVMNKLGITDESERALTEAQLRTEAQTVYTEALREEALLATADLEPVGYVYLGPIIPTSREFCIELDNTWLAIDEIARLDNGMDDGPVLVTCGGYNCEHDWLPLFGDQTKEYEHGDWQAANAAAER